MTEKIAPRGTILTARNGEVIGYDESGLILRLSDRVIADIARRLSKAEAVPVSASLSVPAPSPGSDGEDAGILGDLDAWDLRVRDGWYLFSANLPGADGPRQYRMRVPRTDRPQGSVMADAPGALLALLSIGGARAAWALPEGPAFPYHVLSLADDIGAVGMAGVEDAPETDALGTLREVTRDARLADTLLTDRWAARRAMPLYVVRAETDASPSVADLIAGKAMANLMRAADNLRAAADSMAKPARIVAVRLDFSLEDVVSDAGSYRDGMLALMAAITAGLTARGFHKPLFHATFDCGTARLSDHPVLRGQWDLAWNSGDHDLIFTAPGYGFAQDAYGRPTPAAMAEMAVIEAAAITASYEDQPWFCPVFLLAEMEPKVPVLRVKARAMSGLVIDPGDPLGAGPTAGFRLAGATNTARILSVAVAEDDPQDLLLTLDKRPEGDSLTLLYGFGAEARDNPGAGHPAMAGALRDDWQSKGPAGRTLHRWALPCALPVH